MRSASSKTLIFAGLALLLSTGSAFAASTVEGWNFSSAGDHDQVRISWNEAANVQVDRFEGARQVIFTLPEASLKPNMTNSIDLASARNVKAARLRAVTLPNGAKGLQVTIDLKEWADVTPIAGSDALTISVAVPEGAKAATARANDAKSTKSSSRELVLTDEEIAKMDSLPALGSPDAPETGAGQASGGKITEYYVPPNVTRAGTVATPALDTMEVENKLNERVRRVDFQGTSLENVLRLIADQAELNILIKPEDVKGRTVTLRLRNISLRNMLEALLKANELGYTIDDGGIVRILPRDQVKSTAKETVTQVIPINWVDADEVASILRPFLDREDGKVQVSKTSNQIIIRDVPENVQQVQDLIASLDVPEKQVLIELRLVNMSETARRDFGTRTGFNTQDTTSRAIDENGLVGTRSITNSSTSSNTSNNTLTEDLLSGLTGSNSSNSTGSNSSSSSSTSSVGDFYRSRGSAGLLSPTASALTFSQLANVSFLGQDYDVNFELNAQEERGEAVTLANPTVLSLNNTQAKVEIQREIPYVQAQNSTDGSVGTIAFKEVGTTVEVLPRITNNGYVQLNIKPEQIIDTGDRPQGVPVTDERRVEASVTVKDEQTIALGGLREFSAVSSEAGVPYLLRVPVLSWLFKNQSNTQTKTELYLFVTPRIVKDPAPTAYQQALYEKIDYNWDLPDYYFDEVSARKGPGENVDPSARK